MERSGVFSSFRPVQAHCRFPDRSFFQQVQTHCVHTMTGPSHAACNIRRDLHFRLDRYRDAALLYYCSLYHCSEDLPLNCCNCSAAGRAQRLEWAMSSKATWSASDILVDSVSKPCSCRLTMEPSRGECQALRARPERKVCNSQVHLLHLPQHLSHLKQEKPTTTTLNRKTKDRRQQQLFAASRMRTSFAPCVQTGGGKAGSPLDPEEPSLSSIKQAPYFHCTIARLAAAHTFLMAEISRHALTDLSTLSNRQLPSSQSKPTAVDRQKGYSINYGKRFPEPPKSNKERKESEERISEVPPRGVSQAFACKHAPAHLSTRPRVHKNISVGRPRTSTPSTPHVRTNFAWFQSYSTRNRVPAHAQWPPSRSRFPTNAPLLVLSTIPWTVVTDFLLPSMLNCSCTM